MAAILQAAQQPGTLVRFHTVIPYGLHKLMRDHESCSSFIELAQQVPGVKLPESSVA